ncbi:MAG: LacI family DNA-binding transcriptional regulator [Planctomycetota bacterium]
MSTKNGTTRTRGDQGVSVRELASRLGVSTATVSRALNDHPSVSHSTRQRVLDMADATGYTPKVGQRQACTIGLVYPSHPVMPDFGSFESAMLSGVMRGLAEHRYDLSLIEIDRDRIPGESYVRFFRRKGVRGVITRTISNEPTLAEAIAAEGFPGIVVADRSDDPSVSFICSDSLLDSKRAIEHLILQGHRRIGLVVHTVLDSDHRDRLAGYEAGLAAHGIEIDRDLIVTQPASMDGGRAALLRLLRRENPPTAMYCTNPLTTVGVLHACLELGIDVPKQLSVVGFDDSDTRYKTFPRYTAVCQEADQLGYEAARWLTRTLEGVETKPMRTHRPTTLSFNQSTGPVPFTPVRISPALEEVIREPT